MDEIDVKAIAQQGHGHGRAGRRWKDESTMSKHVEATVQQVHGYGSAGDDRPIVTSRPHT